MLTQEMLSHWNLLLVRESLRNCLLEAVTVARHPWKGPYVK